MVQAIPSKSIQLFRRKLVEQILGISRSTIYRRVNEGTFPRPIHIGANSVGWPSHEVDAISKALISGSSNNEIKILVQKLHAERNA